MLEIFLLDSPDYRMDEGERKWRIRCSLRPSYERSADIFWSRRRILLLDGNSFRKFSRVRLSIRGDDWLLSRGSLSPKLLLCPDANELCNFGCPWLRPMPARLNKLSSAPARRIVMTSRPSRVEASIYVHAEWCQLHSHCFFVHSHELSKTAQSYNEIKSLMSFMSILSSFLSPFYSSTTFHCLRRGTGNWEKYWKRKL